MDKKVIIIKTTGLSIVIGTENFSKENVISEIGIALSIDKQNIEQLSASTSGGIFGVKEKYPSVEPYATNPVSDINYANTLEVEYGIMI